MNKSDNNDGLWLLGLSGWARSGKDSVAEVLGRDCGYRTVSFGNRVMQTLVEVDPQVQVGPGPAVRRVSELAAELGYEKAKAIPEVRALLQRLGVAGRSLDSGLWVRATLDGLSRDSRWAVSGVRYPEEARAILDAGGSVWRVNRPGVVPLNNDQTETALDQWDGFSRVLDNDGTLKDLEGKVLAALSEPR